MRAAGQARKGCGSRALVPQGEVVGVDLSAEMVATAWRNARNAGALNAAYFQADIARLPEHFQERFDAVYCSLASTSYPQPLGAAREMHRVLAPGGYAFVADPGPAWYNLLSASLAKWADPGWIGFHTPDEFRDLFLEAGFAGFYWQELLPGIGLGVASK